MEMKVGSARHAVRGLDACWFELKPATVPATWVPCPQPEMVMRSRWPNRCRSIPSLPPGHWCVAFLGRDVGIVAGSRLDARVEKLVGAPAARVEHGRIPAIAGGASGIGRGHADQRNGFGEGRSGQLVLVDRYHVGIGGELGEFLVRHLDTEHRREVHALQRMLFGRWA